MQIYEMRRLRQQFLPQSILAEPAWDILLTLYIGQENQVRINVSDVCASASVPAATATRWIKKLINLGLVEITANPMDGRASWVSLSGDATRRLENFCDALAKFPHGTDV